MFGRRQVPEVRSGLERCTLLGDVSVSDDLLLRGGPGTSGVSITRELLYMLTLRPHPRPMETEALAILGS